MNQSARRSRSRWVVRAFGGGEAKGEKYVRNGW
jgi:hypothetical protein